MTKPLPPPSARAVLITGCSTGIGRASALAFVRAGFPTFATARNLDAIADLRTAGCTTLRLDVTEEASMRAAVAEVEARHGAVGVLVNNAGYGVYGPLEILDIDEVRREFETNVIGLVRLTQLALPGMRRAGGGRVINVSSVAGRVIMPGAGAYHASKFAVEAFAGALRPEVAPFGIAVVNIQPGPVATAFQAKTFTATPAGDDPYAPFTRNLRKMMRGSGIRDRLKSSADEVARVILRAATVRNPRRSYPVGPMAKLVLTFLPLVPKKVLDRAFVRRLWR